MIAPRLSRGAVVGRLPPEGIGRVPIGRETLPIGRDILPIGWDELPTGRDAREAAMGLLPCWEAAVAEGKSGAWLAVVHALVLSDARCAPETQHFLCFVLWPDPSCTCINQQTPSASLLLLAISPHNCSHLGLALCICEDCRQAAAVM